MCRTQDYNRLIFTFVSLPASFPPSLIHGVTELQVTELHRTILSVIKRSKRSLAPRSAKGRTLYLAAVRESGGTLCHSSPLIAPIRHSTVPIRWLSRTPTASHQLSFPLSPQGLRSRQSLSGPKAEVSTLLQRATALRS